MKTECPICGKEFEPKQSNYSICSPECRKIYARQYQKKYHDENREALLAKKKTQPSYLKKLAENRKKQHLCSICGKPVQWDRYRHPLRHDECVLTEIISSVNAGNRITDAQYQQLQARGYSIKEFRAEYADILTGCVKLASERKQK